MSLLRKQCIVANIPCFCITLNSKTRICRQSALNLRFLSSDVVISKIFKVERVKIFRSLCFSLKLQNSTNRFHHKRAHSGSLDREAYRRDALPITFNGFDHRSPLEQIGRDRTHFSNAIF